MIYLIPSLRISARFTRIDLGAIIYASHPSSDWHFDYPFNGSHRLKPALGVELGDEGIYIFVKANDLFPLYSGGGLTQLGIGGRFLGFYEHKAFITGGPFQDVGLGYRGEFRVRGNSAVSLGFAVGGTDHGSVYSFTVGVKTVLGK